MNTPNARQSNSDVWGLTMPHFSSACFLIAAFVVGSIAQPTTAQDSKPKWMIAHKVNQLVDPKVRHFNWFHDMRHYPVCWGLLSGTEESLDQYFDGPNYIYSGGLEFDVWYNEPGDDINGHGADQQDIHGNDVTVGNWYVSHEPCDDDHVWLDEYIGYLKSKLDVYGAGRCRLLYVDIKAPYNHTGVFDPITQIRTKLRSGLGVHFWQMNIIFSTAAWEDRGVFAQDNFAGTLRANELIGIDETIHSAHSDTVYAATVARDWAKNELSCANVYFSDKKAICLPGCEQDTRHELIRLKNEENYPQIVGGWTIESNASTTSVDNEDVDEFYNEGVNLFMMENYWETGDGTGSYFYLRQKIDNDPNAHLAIATDRPWLPDVEIGAITSDGQDVSPQGFSYFSQAVVGLPIQVEGIITNHHDVGGEYTVLWQASPPTSGSYDESGVAISSNSYISPGVFNIDFIMVSDLTPAQGTGVGQVQVVELDESIELVAFGLTSFANNPAEPPEVVELLQNAVEELEGSGGVLELLGQSRWHPGCLKVSSAVELISQANDLTQTFGLTLARRQLIRCSKAFARRSLQDAVADGLDQDTAMFVNNMILQGTLYLADDLEQEALNEFCRVTEFLHPRGDMNLDGEVNLLDVDPFVQVVINGDYTAIADINGDGQVNLLDVAPFVDLLTGS